MQLERAKANMTREEVVTAVREIAEHRLDLVVPERGLAWTDDGRLAIQSPGTQALAVRPTQRASGQVSDALSIPRKYWTRMEENAPDLLAHNVNAWLERSDRSRLLRLIHGSEAMRAYLSDRYLPLDNEIPMMELARAMDDPDVEYVGGWADHEGLSLRVARRAPHAIKPGDLVKFGVVVQNSEVGAGALTVRPYVLRLVCTNGMVADVGGDFAGLRKVHIGGPLGRGEEVPLSGYFSVSQETIRAHSRAAASEARDVIRAMLAPEAHDEIARRLRAAANHEVRSDSEHSISDVVENVTERIGLNQAETEYVLERFLGAGDHTTWGLANAVTAQAHDAENGARRDDLESAGWQVIDLPQRAWSEAGAEVN